MNNILILGSGGREHTLAWAIAKSSKVDKIFVAPGNAGTNQEFTNLALNPNDFEAVAEAVADNNISMLVVGPEDPLVNGIVDFFKNDDFLKNIKIIGPDKQAALLEGSKSFSKEFMQKHNIPTARYKSFTKDTLSDAYSFLDSLQAPYVLKADGLAAGKGVLILDNVEEAKAELAKMFEGKFGDAGKTVVIEEYLDGIEVSFFALTDGENYVLFPEAKDYKRIGEGDTGLNTGGMGAVSPVSFVNDDFKEKVIEKVIKPTIAGIKSEGFDYRGFVFFGLMNVNGEPYVIEYNVRMGDPETEVVLPRIKSDLFELLEKTYNKQLNNEQVAIDHRTAVTVMLVSGGYPESYEKGKEITGLDEVVGSIVFHAGTKTENNKVLTSGGRVMALTSFGNDIAEALNISYKNAETVNFDKKYYRKDIGRDLM